MPTRRRSRSFSSLVPLLVLSCFGLLFLSGCGKEVKTYVYDEKGNKLGEIQFENDDNATIVDTHGEVAGRVRGALVRNASGKKIGTVEQKDGSVMFLDAEGNAMGSLEDGSDCYGKGPEKLGHINAEIDIEAAGAACMVLLLQ
jgi:hypothetical protein